MLWLPFDLAIGECKSSAPAGISTEPACSSATTGALASKLSPCANTRVIVRDLPQLVERFIGLFLAKLHNQYKSIASSQKVEITDAAVQDLIFRFTEVWFCSIRPVSAVFQDAFESRNELRLFHFVHPKIGINAEVEVRAPATKAAGVMSMTIKQ